MTIEVTGTSTGDLRTLPTLASYAPADQSRVHEVTTWLREHKESRAWLASRARMSNGTVSQVLAGRYPSPPTELLERMLAVLRVESERLSDGTPGYVEGSLHKLVFVVCDRIRKHRSMGAVVGWVGIGKTRTLREVQARRPQTLVVEANPSMTAGSLLIELIQQLNAPLPTGLDRMFRTVVKALAGTDYLLLVDEAEYLNATALHYLRRIHDKAQVGVVLSGTTKLLDVIPPQRGQFDQIRSRISMWPKTVEGITRDDMDDMARMALRDMTGHDGNPVEPTDDVLDALWAYCHGSARVLMKEFLPALRDYVIGRKALTANLVDSIAQTVLYMEKRVAK